MLFSRLLIQRIKFPFSFRFKSTDRNLIDELNDLLGENSYIIETNGKKIDLTSEYDLSEDETYKIWPKVLGGKVS